MGSKFWCTVAFAGNLQGGYELKYRFGLSCVSLRSTAISCHLSFSNSTAGSLTAVNLALRLGKLSIHAVCFFEAKLDLVVNILYNFDLFGSHTSLRPLLNWPEVMVNWTPVKKFFLDLNNSKFALLGSHNLWPLKLLAKLCANQVKLMANLLKNFQCHGIWREVLKCWIEILHYGHRCLLNRSKWYSIGKVVLHGRGRERRIW